ncbi:MAG: DUF6291 domain-containing protein [Butyrivibrio sp.]
MSDAGDKKSFVLYCDYAPHISLLTDEDAGKLFKAIFSYEETGEVKELSPIASMAFSFMRSQLDRDRDKWEEVRAKRAEAGRQGGLAKAKQKKANANCVKQNKANQAVIVTEYGTVNANGDGDDKKHVPNDNEECKTKMDNGNVKCNKYFDDSVLNKTFLDYIDMRKEIKSPLTDHGINLAISKLNAMSSDVNEKIEILNQSILNGWKGIFPLNKQNQGISKKSNFNNFEQRQYDYVALERKLLESQ